MAEPLKNIFSPALAERFADDVRAVYPAFDGAGFQARVLDAGFDGLELKQRMRRFSTALRAALPDDYGAALGVVVRTAERLLDRRGEGLGFEYIFVPDFVEAFGLDDPDRSLPALETITRLCSAEFAVRPFLVRYPARMYAQMLAWADHPSAYVRRLASEGFRPRLPWGLGVPALKRDPSPILPVLEKLKNDPAETVRRSVANNLNDIAKDHPDLVLEIAERWRGQSAEIDRIVRHACRGLLKRGDARTLAHFGFAHGQEGIVVSGLAAPPAVRIGERLPFSFTVKNETPSAVPVRLEYAIDYKTSSGKTSRKVFKISELSLAGGQSAHVARTQRFEDFTTRKHFPGGHRLAVLVNGVEKGAVEFEVLRS